MMLQRSPSSDAKDLYDTKPGMALASISILSASTWNSWTCSGRRRDRNTMITIGNLCAQDTMNESRRNTLGDRQQRTRRYHAVQAEARPQVEIPDLVLGSLPAPATRQHAHVGRQDRDVFPRIRPRPRNERVDAEQSAVRRDRLPAEAENPQRVIVVPAVQY